MISKILYFVLKILAITAVVLVLALPLWIVGQKLWLEQALVKNTQMGEGGAATLSEEAAQEVRRQVEQQRAEDLQRMQGVEAILKKYPQAKNFRGKGSLYVFDFSEEGDDGTPKTYTSLSSVQDGIVTSHVLYPHLQVQEFNDKISVELSVEDDMQKLTILYKNERLAVREAMLLTDDDRPTFAHIAMVDTDGLEQDRFILYHLEEWEGWALGVYDIKQRQEVALVLSPVNAQFTPDGKYFYACSASPFHGTFTQDVYETQTFEKVFEGTQEMANAAAGGKNILWEGMVCGYDAERNEVYFDAEYCEDACALTNAYRTTFSL